MRNALIGIAVVALALSSTFGATVYLSTSNSVFPTAAPANTVPTLNMAPGASATLYIWVDVRDADGTFSCSAININQSKAGGITATSAAINNPTYAYTSRASGPRWQTTGDYDALGSGSTVVADMWAAAVDSGVGMASWTKDAYGTDTQTAMTGAADWAYLWGSFTFTAAQSTDLSLSTGFKTWANKAGTPTSIVYGSGAAVVGNTEGTTNGAVVAKINVVPEPATMALLTIGGIAGLLRRRNA